MKTSEMAAQFQRLRPKFEEAVDLMLVHVRHLLRGHGLMHPDEVSHRVIGRVKATESFVRKVRRLEKQRGKPFRSVPQALGQIHDIAGVRVVCNYLQDVLLVYGYLRRHPAFHEVKGRLVDYIHKPRLGYRSLHAVVSIRTSFGVARCEVQIRTALQDAWAVKSHALVYKLNKEDLSKLPLQVQNLLIQQSDLLYNLDKGAEDIADLIRAALRKRK